MGRVLPYTRLLEKQHCSTGEAAEACSGRTVVIGVE